MTLPTRPTLAPANPKNRSNFFSLISWMVSDPERFVKLMRVVPGGVIIFDDYEWSGIYRPQKIAEDAWLDARQYRVSPLPTGQGFVIKR